GLDSDPARIAALIKWAHDLQTAIDAFQIDDVPPERIAAHVAGLLAHDISRFRSGGQVRRAFDAMQQAFPAMYQAAKDVGACIGLDRPEEIIRLEPGWIDALQERSARWKANIIKAPQWATWRAAAKTARAARLSPLVDAVEEGR